MPHPENVNPDQCILLTGGPGDGFEAIGPFDSSDDAIDYAETKNIQDNWWVMPMTPVQCDDEGNWIEPSFNAYDEIMKGMDTGDTE